MALLLCTSFLAFAAPLTDSNVSVIPTKQGVLTTPVGNKISMDSISFENGLEGKNLETSLQSKIVRNRVVINKNSTTPLFSFEEGGPIYEDSSLTISESYSDAPTMKWLNVSKAKQEALYKKLSDSNRIFVAWKNTCEYTVDSPSPIAITYSIGDGEEMTKRVDRGPDKEVYETNPGDFAIWSGYLRYNSGTTMFNGGVNFLKN